MGVSHEVQIVFLSTTIPSKAFIKATTVVVGRKYPNPKVHHSLLIQQDMLMNKARFDFYKNFIDENRFHQRNLSLATKRLLQQSNTALFPFQR